MGQAKREESSLQFWKEPSSREQLFHKFLVGSVQRSEQHETRVSATWAIMDREPLPLLSREPRNTELFSSSIDKPSHVP